MISNKIYWALDFPNTEFKHIFFFDRLLEHSSSRSVHLNMQQVTLPELAVSKPTSETLSCCWHLSKFWKTLLKKYFCPELSYELAHREECFLSIYYQYNLVRSTFLFLAYVCLSSLDYCSIDSGTPRNHHGNSSLGSFFWVMSIKLLYILASSLPILLSIDKK